MPEVIGFYRFLEHQRMLDKKKRELEIRDIERQRFLAEQQREKQLIAQEKRSRTEKRIAMTRK
jgi:hypothetical protein